MNPPPLLVNFESTKQLLAALPSGLLDRYSRQINTLVEEALPPLVSVPVLALLFGYSSKFVGLIKKKPERFYRRFRISKGRGFRAISAPRVALKSVQKWFGHHLANAVEFPEYVTGFVPGRSHFDAARIHAGSNWVFSVDIANFFPSIPKKRVSDALESLGYSSYSAELAASFTCIGGRLAQGSPASPVLANLVLRSLDSHLFALAQRHVFRYSRYADDLVFSGRADLPDQEFIDSIKEAVVRDGWVLAKSKEYLAASPRRLKVHGMLVESEYPRLTKGYRNKLRAFRHELLKKDLPEEDRRRMAGHIAYADSVDRFFPR